MSKGKIFARKPDDSTIKRPSATTNMATLQSDKKRKRRDSNGEKSVFKKEKICFPTCHGDIVWAKPNGEEEKWPARILNPQNLPSSMQIEDGIFVKFFRESRTKFAWVKENKVCGFFEGLEEYGNRAKPQEPYFVDFKQAIERALLASHGFFDEEGNSQANVYEPNCSCSTINNGLKCGVCVDCKKYCPKCHELTSRDCDEVWAACEDCERWFHKECLKMEIEEHVCSDCYVKRVEKSYPETVNVVCRGLEGVYCHKSHLVCCSCKNCGGHREIALAEFERHAGSRAKKWKASVRVKETNDLLKNWIDEGNRIGAIPYCTDSFGPGKSRNETLKELSLSNILKLEYTPVVAEWPSHKCCACKDPLDYDVNKLVTCRKCKLVVHQFCYGLEKEQGVEASWVCKACEKPDDIHRCCLCPVEGGPIVAMATRIKTPFWVHTTCANYIDGIYFENDRIDMPNGILALDHQRFQESCIICNQVHGCCITCKTCKRKFHAMCGLLSGCEMSMEQVHIKGQTHVVPLTYCLEHSPKVIMQDVASSSSSDGQGESESEQECMPEAVGAARCRVYDRAMKNKKLVFKPLLLKTCGISSHSKEEINKMNGHKPMKRLEPIQEHILAARKLEGKRLYLGKSGIHGIGLFAKRQYRKGDLVVEYRGEIISNKTADYRESKYKRLGIDCYMFSLADNVIIDASVKGNIARYINHCCEPNCHSKIVETEGENFISLLATRDIEEEEELTFDYHFNKEGESIRCRCGAVSCRKFL